MRKIYSSLLGILLLSSASLQAQTSTYMEVYNIFQANCTVGCHSGTSPSAGLNLAGTPLDVYDALVDATPVNPYAKDSLGQKLIDPGYPYNSFLLRKINNGLDPKLDLQHVAEGSVMPASLQPALDNWEIEMVRQWILFGASDTGTYVSPSTLVSFYSGNGIVGTQRPRSPEEDGLEGYQVRIGPIFMDPLSEIEFFIKQEVGLPGPKEVTRIDGIMNEESHHYALFDFESNAASLYGDGLFKVDGIADVAYIHNNSHLLGAWQYNRDMVLPENTAFRWDENSVLAINYHILNYNSDSILKADAYINIYTQDTTAGTKEMLPVLDQLGGVNPYVLEIPPASIIGGEHTEGFYYKKPGKIWDIWSLQAHSHSLSTDYDVFLVNPDNSIGDQIYEGFYNTDYTFNQGTYDYAHPPTRTWDDFLTVDMTYGLYFQCKWLNTTNDTVGFGFTAADEMMAFYMHTLENTDGVGIGDLEIEKTNISIYPNPMSTSSFVNVTSDIQIQNGELNLYDVYGKLVRRVSGINSNSTILERDGLASGIYVYNLSNKDELVGTGRLVVQ